MSAQAKNPLTIIPGVGPSIAGDLNRLGIKTPNDLVGKNPQMLYDSLGQLDGGPHDPCVLYTFRCAVYFASHKQHDPELLKWWNWKDRTSI